MCGFSVGCNDDTAFAPAFVTRAPASVARSAPLNARANPLMNRLAARSPICNTHPLGDSRDSFLDALNFRLSRVGARFYLQTRAGRLTLGLQAASAVEEKEY